MKDQDPASGEKLRVQDMLVKEGEVGAEAVSVQGRVRHRPLPTAIPVKISHQGGGIDIYAAAQALQMTAGKSSGRRGLAVKGYKTGQHHHEIARTHRAMFKKMQSQGMGHPEQGTGGGPGDGERRTIIAPVVEGRGAKTPPGAPVGKAPGPEPPAVDQDHRGRITGRGGQRRRAGH